MKSTRIISTLCPRGLPPWLAHPACVLLVLLLFLSSSALRAEFGDFIFENEGVGVGARVTGYLGSSGAVVIPERFGGLPVTSIGNFAFSGYTGLTSVTIPNSVTSIGWYAFSGCTGLTSVTIPNSLTGIGGGAFSGCTGLISIAVDPLNSKYLALEGVLFNKSLTILVQYPGGKAGSYTIPSSVTSIQGWAFSGCTGLTSVTIPNSVTTIQESAFSGCTGLTNVTIPNSVTTIEGWAFSGCTGLISVTIPNSVTTIQELAFYGCRSLTSVTIPNSVTTIVKGAFYDCTGLTSIEVDPLNSKYGGLEGVLFNKGLTALVQYPGGKAGSYYMIPNSVTNIREGAFRGCTGLTSITIPNSVTTIGWDAFYDCTGLTGVYFQGQPPAIQGSTAFFGIDRTTLYYLPGSTGWGETFGGRPTALWLPQMRNVAASFSVPGNQFGFDVSWAPGQTVVVEVATNIAAPAWSPLQTITLTGDSIHFSDPQWTFQPIRFYRLRTP